MVTGLEKVNVIYVNNKILELQQLLSKSCENSQNFYLFLF